MISILWDFIVVLGESVLILLLLTSVIVLIAGIVNVIRKS